MSFGAICGVCGTMLFAPGRAYDGPAEVAALTPIARDHEGPRQVGPLGSASDDRPERQGLEVGGRTPTAMRWLVLTDLGARDPLTELGSGRVRFRPGVQVRTRIDWLAPFVVDADGDVARRGGAVSGRVRWHPRLEVGRVWSLEGMLDVANGRWAPRALSDPSLAELEASVGAPSQVPDPFIDPRELEMNLRVGSLEVHVGQRAWTWGEGMVFSDGDHRDRFGDVVFGDDGPGDLFEQVLISGRPARGVWGPAADLFFGVGGDVVFRDEEAELVEGDLAGRAFVLLGWASSEQPEQRLGLQAVYRHQTSSAESGEKIRSDLGLVDVAGRGVQWLTPRLQVSGAFEGAIRFGRTIVPDAAVSRRAVRAGGLLLRGFIGDEPRWMAGAELGYASGDADPHDDVDTRFAFDRGAPAGLILLPRVLGWQSQAAELAAADQGLQVTSKIATDGAVSRVVYVHPKARVSPWDGVELWAGPLLAWSPNPMVDPYASYLAGGQPRNHVGGDGAGRYYGTELDVGLRWQVVVRGVWFQAGVQAAVAWPGAALVREGDPVRTVSFVQLRSEVRY